MNKVAFFLTALYLLLTPTLSFGAEVPSFPTCANPNGDLKVQHSSGTHGIVGNSATYSGSDSVYSLTDGNVMQCFCAVDGTGIQTNWWKVSSLSDAERKVLESQGWNYVPDGALWGLESGLYLAKNISYSCRGGGSSSGSNSSSASTNGSGGTSGVAGVSSSVSGTIGEVLGLATTGTIQMIILLFSIGIGLISLGFLLRRNSIKK